MTSYDVMKIFQFFTSSTSKNTMKEIRGIEGSLSNLFTDFENTLHKRFYIHNKRGITKDVLPQSVSPIPHNFL